MKKVKVKKGELKGKESKCIELTDGTLVFDAEKDVEDLLYTAYLEKFQTGKTTEKGWLSSFIDDSLDQTVKDVKQGNNSAIYALHTINNIVKQTQDYFDAKKAVNIDMTRYLLQTDLFEWQKKVYESARKQIAMLCGRRAGKTFVVTRLAFKALLEKGPKKKTALIVGLTMEKTAYLYWDLIKETVEKAHIPVSKIDNGRYRVTLSNGNELMLGGNGSKDEREKCRGADHCFVAIDEMQSQKGLYYLINDILKPILKGTDGTLVCLGTGPISAGTLWENIQADSSWEHFRATMQDNPTIPNYETALQDVLNENHWTKDNITFRREYLGDIAYDTERLLYPVRTYYDTIPADFHPTACYIGVDFGWRDYSSFAPILVDDKGEGYLIKEWKQNKTSASALVDVAKKLVESIHKDWKIPMEDIKLIADSSHQQVSSDFYNAGLTNIQNAYKPEENYQVARLSEALEVGYLHILKDGYFDQECNALVWKWNSEKGCVIYQIDDDIFHPDIADSVKYAWNTYLSDRLVTL